MALSRKGSPVLTLQHGWTIEEDENYLLTGECTWEGDIAYRGTFNTLKGSLHPYEPRLTCYRTRLKRLPTNKCQITASYIGVSFDPTPMFIEHPGGSGQDPIETHPDFVDFAGTPETPLNGATFDADTNEFVGFSDPADAANLFGTRAYIVPSVLVNLSYYSHRYPDIGDVGRRFNQQIPDLIKPANVKNFLLVGMPYRRIGNLFQISLQVLGSGPNGWNRKIYGA